MKNFEVKGMVKLKGSVRPFSKVVSGKSEKHAVEKVFSLFGSANGIKRESIKIEMVKECK